MVNLMIAQRKNLEAPPRVNFGVFSYRGTKEIEGKKNRLSHAFRRFCHQYFVRRTRENQTIQYRRTKRKMERRRPKAIIKSIIPHFRNVSRSINDQQLGIFFSLHTFIPLLAGGREKNMRRKTKIIKRFDRCF